MALSDEERDSLRAVVHEASEIVRLSRTLANAVRKDPQAKIKASSGDKWRAVQVQTPASFEAIAHPIKR
jgi:hypothetical protein